LCYTDSKNCSLLGYIDNDYEGSLDDYKSTSGYAFDLGTNLISWEFKKQSIVSIYSAEAKYVAANSTTCQVVWLGRLLKYISNIQKEPTPIYCDNNSTISLSKSHVFHNKRKHIDTRFHFIRELHNDDGIVISFCGSKDKLANIFTKTLGKNVF